MKAFKGTPGPWYIDEGWLKGHVSISADSHSAFAQVVAEMEWEGGEFEKDPNNSYYRRWCKENEPLVKNAKLIAAAPQLLEALQQVVSDLFYQLEAKHGPEAASKHPAIVEARAVIESALGENV